MFNKNLDVSLRFDFSYFFEKVRLVEYVYFKIGNFWYYLNIMLSRLKYDWIWFFKSLKWGFFWINGILNI